MSSIGLFSTLTSAGSRRLVTTIAEACRAGEVGARVAFLLCNREEGESAETDASVEAVRAELGLEVVRSSAVRFEAERRKAARIAAEAGDEEPLWAWRDDYYATYRDRLPETDLDLLLGDMWIWGRRQCADRRGVNLHPALPTGPLGKMWFDVIWDLIAGEEEVSGVMLHRVTPEVDRGPIVSYCSYGLRSGLEDLWSTIPDCLEERVPLIAAERSLRRESAHPLFRALRARGLDREMPLMLQTVRAVSEGRLRLEPGGGVVDGSGRQLAGGLDLTDEVEAAVSAAESVI